MAKKVISIEAGVLAYGKVRDLSILKKTSPKIYKASHIQNA